MCAHVEEEIAGTRYYPIWWERFKFQELSTCVCVCVWCICVRRMLHCVSDCFPPSVCVCVLCYSWGAVCLFACNLESFIMAGGVSNKPERSSIQILMLWRLQYPFLLTKHTLRGECWNHSQHRRYKSKSLMQSRKKGSNISKNESAAQRSDAKTLIKSAERTLWWSRSSKGE